MPDEGLGVVENGATIIDHALAKYSTMRLHGIIIVLSVDWEFKNVELSARK